MKPLLVDTRMLRPLPKTLFQSPCSNCDKRQAMWEMGPERSDECVFVCSLCFLYESRWGESRREQIDILVDEVQVEAGEKFLRATDGKQLLSCKDADRILGSIALTSRMFRLEDKMKGLQGK